MTQAPQTLRSWLEEGPFTLALSSGFFGFFAHAGFLRVLEEEGLSPQRVSGSSAGALIGGLWASGRTMAEIQPRLFALQRDEFWDPGPGLGLLRGHLFEAELSALLATTTFEGCRVPLSLSIFDLLKLRTHVVRSGPLVPAIRASCSFPGLLQPARADGRWALDGGIGDRPGLAGVAAGERVLYHHLQSRSRIRGRFQSLTGVPRQDGLRGVIVDALPRVGPYHLDRGPAAFERAYRALSEGLDAPLEGDGSVLRLSRRT